MQTRQDRLDKSNRYWKNVLKGSTFAFGASVSFGVANLLGVIATGGISMAVALSVALFSQMTIGLTYHLTNREIRELNYYEDKAWKNFFSYVEHLTNSKSYTENDKSIIFYKDKKGKTVGSVKKKVDKKTFKLSDENDSLIQDDINSYNRLKSRGSPFVMGKTEWERTVWTFGDFNIVQNITTYLAIARGDFRQSRKQIHKEVWLEYKQLQIFGANDIKEYIHPRKWREINNGKFRRKIILSYYIPIGKLFKKVKGGGLQINKPDTIKKTFETDRKKFTSSVDSLLKQIKKRTKNKLSAVFAFKKAGKKSELDDLEKWFKHHDASNKANNGKGPKRTMSTPAFDPFPFATQIKQKEHKIYKNLRY